MQKFRCSLSSTSALFAAVAVSGLQVALGAGTCGTEPSQRASVRSSVSQSLKTQGYSSHKGTYSCASGGTSGASNPESNTCMFHLPGAVPLVDLPVFQLGVSDVVVYLGCTPAAPGPVYYGFSHYLAGFNLLKIPTPMGQMVDSLNQIGMKSTGGGLPGLWGSTMAMVITADRTSADDVVAALAAAGFPPAAVNVVVVPSAELKLGTGPLHNYLLFGARVGPFANATQRAQHIEESEEEVLVIRGGRRAAQADPYPTPARRSRVSDQTELDMKAVQSTVLDEIASNRAEAWEVASRVELGPMLRDGVYSNGDECISNRSTAGCAMDTDDAGYMVGAEPFEALTEGEEDWIVGANTALTGMAVYSSAAVYTAAVGSGQNTIGGAAMSSVEYGGSAARFAQGAENLFAVRVTYGLCGAGEPWCLNATVTDTQHQLLYVTRAYLNPATGTGPDPYQLLPAVVLRLRRKQAVSV